jgi:hypothetical protein
MFRSGIDTFALVISYLDEAWTPRHVIVSLFKVHETMVMPWLCNFNFCWKKLD